MSARVAMAGGVYRLKSGAGNAAARETSAVAVAKISVGGEKTAVIFGQKMK